MEEALELALGSDLLQRAVFPDVGIAADMVEHSVRQDEEAAIDPSALVGRLFLKTEDDRALDAEATEPAWRTPGGDRRHPAVRRVEPSQFPDVHVGQTVAIGHQEIRLVLAIVTDQQKR